MQDTISALMKSPLFAGVSEEIIEKKVLKYGRLREYPEGKYLICLHDEVNDLGIILKGRVQIIQLFSDGTKSLVNVLTAPQVIGIDLIYTKTTLSPYYAVTSEKTTVLQLNREILFSEEIWGKELSHCFLKKILMILSHENMKKHYRLAILAQKGLRARITMYLTMQSNRKENTSIYIPFSREELANYLCVNRSALSHELKLMEKDGLIAFHKNHFILQNKLFEK